MFQDAKVNIKEAKMDKGVTGQGRSKFKTEGHQCWHCVWEEGKIV